ncbi:MAG: S8 family peptidase [Flavobacteriales bacterium]|nr:S8 family peptidase [Flavobacteriales bacterium]
MRKLLTLTLSACLMLTSVVSQAQEDKRSRFDRNLSKEMPANPNQLERPKPSQDHQGEIFDFSFLDPGIRWYAIENKDNDRYWEHVNTERLWIELEIGLDINSPAIKEFLEANGLDKVFRSSMNKSVSNYYVFEIEGGTKEDILSMVYNALEVEGILFAEPSVLYTNFFTPNDPFWGNQWGPYSIYADEAWNTTTGGSWNVIGVIDDACDYTHEDLWNQVQYGFDYGFNDADPYPDWDDQTHGTHVTGTIAATIDNGIGIAGMVNDTVYFAKVTDASYTPQTPFFSDAAIVDAIYDMADSDRIGVINMSLGSGAGSAALENACAYAWNQGKFLAVASGNDGTGVIAFPAAYEACTAVGSIGTDGQNLYLAYYSQFGAQQEVCAPGGDDQTGWTILSTYPNNDYVGLQGTSMACPHVAGLAGLILAINPGLSNLDVRNILASTAFDFGDAGWDQLYGYGMVNAQLAVETAQDVIVSVEDEAVIQVNLWPNPANETVRFSFANGVQPEQISLLDLQGRTVDVPVNATARSINTSGLPSGVYLFRASVENQNLTQQIIIQH